MKGCSGLDLHAGHTGAQHRLGLGIGSELAIAVLLVQVAPLAAVLELAPFPAGWLGWMLPVPVLVVLVDDLRKRLLAGQDQRCSISSLAG